MLLWPQDVLGQKADLEEFLAQMRQREADLEAGLHAARGRQAAAEDEALAATTTASQLRAQVRRRASTSDMFRGLACLLAGLTACVLRCATGPPEHASCLCAVLCLLEHGVKPGTFGP